MKKLPALAALFLLSCFGSLSAGAENWIPFPSEQNVLVDTDSYVNGGLRTDISLKIEESDGYAVTALEFDREEKTYRIARTALYGPDGKVKEDHTYSDDQENWNPVIAHSFGGNVYTHYVENPLPHLLNPSWKIIYTEKSSKYRGSSYAIETNTISYKDGYAYFWLRIAYMSKEDDFSQAIYRVKMDVPNKKVQTLSMTQYDYTGKIKAHGAGARKRDSIEADTPMAEVHRYIESELLAGRLHIGKGAHGV